MRILNAGLVEYVDFIIKGDFSPFIISNRYI